MCYLTRIVKRAEDFSNYIIKQFPEGNLFNPRNRPWTLFHSTLGVGASFLLSGAFFRTHQVELITAGGSLLSLAIVGSGIQDIKNKESRKRGIVKIVLSLGLAYLFYSNNKVFYLNKINETRQKIDGFIAEKRYESHIGSLKKTSRRITFGTTYVNDENPERTQLSELVDENHKEYASRWNLEHKTVTKNLVKNQCRGSPYSQDCTPHWNKVKVLKDWLDGPKISPTEEEWYILADDDMPVTNMNIDPYKAIDLLRGGKDQSIIVATDVVSWSGNESSSINTGLLIVRKDEEARRIINSLWEKRNAPGISLFRKHDPRHIMALLCIIITSLQELFL